MERLSTLTDDQFQKAAVADFMRYLSCAAATRGYLPGACELFLQRYPRAVNATVIRKELDGYLTKAAVGAGTTTDASFAAPLVTPAAFADAFIALARSKGVIGRIPNLRVAPFGVRIPIETGGAVYQWVAQNTPKPVSKFSFSNGVTLTATKAGAIVIETAELMKLGAPGAAEALQDDLIAGLSVFTDKAFLDPAAAAVADKNPASITNGTTAITGTGDNYADISKLLKEFFKTRPADDVVLLMDSGTLTSMMFSDWQKSPVTIVTSAVCATLGIVVALDPRGIAVADGGIAIDISDQAALEMVDNPAAPIATTVITDLWGNNLVGLRVERTINWTVAPNAVKYLTLV